MSTRVTKQAEFSQQLQTNVNTLSCGKRQKIAEWRLQPKTEKVSFCVFCLKPSQTKLTEQFVH